MKEKLLKIQLELKAPKSQYNSYGKYKYRNCEDILEAVKPLCGKYNCVLKISDELINIGDRYYVKATATLMDVESDKTISTEAYAREALDKKGMDESQITGAASSYARKYALNGLFNIDDTKDADSQKVDEQKEIDYEKIERELADIKTIDDLKKYYKANKGLGKEFDKMVTNRQKQINETL